MINKARIVRHNGHTFETTVVTRDNYGHARCSFLCKVYGLDAIAFEYGHLWKGWKGPGHSISCGDKIAEIVMGI